MAKTTGLGLRRAGDGLRQPASRTSSSRSPIGTRRWRPRSAAAYMNIPLAHIQGGEVTGSIDEKVRHAVTKLVEPAFRLDRQGAPSASIRMGEEPRRVFVTGCPSIDLAAELLRQPPPTFDPFEKYGGVGARVRPRQRVPRRHAAPGHDRVRRVAPHVDETLHAVARRRPAGALVLAERGRRVRRHLEGHPRRSARRSGRRNIHFFKNMAPDGLPARCWPEPRASSATRASASASARSSACPP